MGIARLRLRVLAAMGLCVTPLLGCKPEGTVVSTPTAATPASETAMPTTTATATVTAATTTAASSTATTEPVPFPRDALLAGCPSGSYCVKEPTSASSGASAPAPYAACLAKVDELPDAGAVARPRHNVSFDPEVTRTTRATDAKACCYRWVQPCAGGRPLRDEAGDAVLAEVRARSDWQVAAPSPIANDDTEASAAPWAREAVYEHASIASFAYLALDLLALGAPAALVRDALRAAGDEVEHARIMFGLASACAGQALGPGGLAAASPRPTPTLAGLVREAIAEGCIGEAMAALALRDRASASPDGAMRALFQRMADDEERHAELAYASVAWALRTGGEGIARVIEEAVAADAHAGGVRGQIVRELAAPCLGALVEACRLDEKTTSPLHVV